MPSRRRLLKGSAVLAGAAVASVPLLNVAPRVLHAAAASQDIGKTRCTGIALYGGEAIVTLQPPYGEPFELYLQNGAGIFQAGKVYDMNFTLE